MAWYNSYAYSSKRYNYRKPLAIRIMDKRFERLEKQRNQWVTAQNKASQTQRTLFEKIRRHPRLSRTQKERMKIKYGQYFQKYRQRIIMLIKRVDAEVEKLETNYATAINKERAKEKKEGIANKNSIIIKELQAKISNLTSLHRENQRILNRLGTYPPPSMYYGSHMAPGGQYAPVSGQAPASGGQGQTPSAPGPTSTGQGQTPSAPVPASTGQGPVTRALTTSAPKAIVTTSGPAQAPAPATNNGVNEIAHVLDKNFQAVKNKLLSELNSKSAEILSSDKSALQTMINSGIESLNRTKKGLRKGGASGTQVIPYSNNMLSSFEQLFQKKLSEKIENKKKKNEFEKTKNNIIKKPIKVRIITRNNKNNHEIKNTKNLNLNLMYSRAMAARRTIPDDITFNLKKTGSMGALASFMQLDPYLKRELTPGRLPSAYFNNSNQLHEVFDAITKKYYQKNNLKGIKLPPKFNTIYPKTYDKIKNKFASHEKSELIKITKTKTKTEKEKETNIQKLFSKYPNLKIIEKNSLYNNLDTNNKYKFMTTLFNIDKNTNDNILKSKIQIVEQEIKELISQVQKISTANKTLKNKRAAFIDSLRNIIRNPNKINKEYSIYKNFENKQKLENIMKKYGLNKKIENITNEYNKLLYIIGSLQKTPKYSEIKNKTEPMIKKFNAFMGVKKLNSSRALLAAPNKSLYDKLLLLQKYRYNFPVLPGGKFKSTSNNKLSKL